MEVPPVKCVHFRLGQYLQGRQSLFCPLTYSVRKDKTMTKKNVTVNYNGEPLKADEVLVCRNTIREGHLAVLLDAFFSYRSY